ncbi:sulfate/molybdate ABC transporter ATP-binding protein [Chryseobacterium sp. A301]
MLLEIKNLDFSYRPEQKLFNNLHLSVDHGKIIGLAGESGCGKSTLLSLIYGLLDWQSGSISLDGKTLLGPKGNIVPGEKEMKLVAQHYDLMPYSTVYDNVGKFISNINLNEKREKVNELLDVVGMQEFAQVKPQFLSGGQQQRVAIARALSVMPKLLLLDEPFSNLDYSRKIELRERLFRYVEDNHISVLISTHNLQEIMPWLDQVLILEDGRLIQNDSPMETYSQPYNSYVAKLLGEVNLIPDDLKHKLSLPKSFYFPEQIQVSPEGFNASVLESRFSGSFFWNKVKVENTTLVVYSKTKLTGEVQIEFA